MRLVVALNLEGTLISNAISAFPRPGLKLFIENVLKTADRVVMFTTVPEDHARGLLQIIEGERILPAGFAAAVEFVPYSGKTKDLSAVGEPAATILLVDDQPSMVHPGQEANWIPIAEFMPPFDQEDQELERVAQIISKRAEP
jgi:TFIIF-interacting CTD phosphatase-like protein